MQFKLYIEQKGTLTFHNSAHMIVLFVCCCSHQVVVSPRVYSTICNSYTMGMSGLPDIYTRSPRAPGLSMGEPTQL